MLEHVPYKYTCICYSATAEVFAIETQHFQRNILKNEQILQTIYRQIKVKNRIREQMLKKAMEVELQKLSLM